MDEQYAAILLRPNRAAEFFPDYSAILERLGRTEAFRCVMENGILGFYDWLWTAEGELAGVRVSVADPSKLRYFVGFENVSQMKSPVPLEILFGSNRSYDSSVPETQDFGGNTIFVGDGGSVLITFFSP